MHEYFTKKCRRFALLRKEDIAVFQRCLRTAENISNSCLRLVKGFPRRNTRQKYFRINPKQLHRRLK